MITATIRLISSCAVLAAAALLGGCATAPPYDYSAFKKSRPASMLVLPPINETADVKATVGVMASTALPLAEAGYYVLPVTLVDETFKQNGLTTANDIHGLPVAKLHEMDAAFK